MTYNLEYLIIFSVNFLFNFAMTWKSYPYLKYYNFQDNDPNKFCEGYLCEHSGLTETVITNMLNIDNEMRNNYAQSHNISNLYMLEWYPVLQHWAQDKANLCLPPTLDEFYDFIAIQKYGVPKHEAEYKDGCQVVITSQPNKAIDTTPQQMKEKITDYISQNRLLHFKRLDESRWDLNRKHVSQVGCGYTIRLNKTHYIDHLVCLYCAFRFKREKLNYKEKKGPPCTNCNYYKTEYPWRCGKYYKYLCVASVTNEKQKPQTIKRNCSKERKDINVKSKKTRFVNFDKLILPIQMNDDFGLDSKKVADDYFQLFHLDDRTEEWSLMNEISKARSFSYSEQPCREYLQCLQVSANYSWSTYLCNAYCSLLRYLRDERIRK